MFFHPLAGGKSSVSWHHDKLQRQPYGDTNSGLSHRLNALTVRKQTPFKTAQHASDYSRQTPAHELFRVNTLVNLIIRISSACRFALLIR